MISTRAHQARPGRLARLVALLGAGVVAQSPIPRDARPAEAPAAGDYVVTYIRTKLQDTADWRIFDPKTRTDSRFGTFTGRAIYWDTTATYAEFVSSFTLYRVRWEWEAQPWPVLVMPGYFIVDWWFNPDSSCWQALTVRAISHGQTPDRRPLHTCLRELWQSDRDGANWRMARTETTGCEDSYAYPGGWKVPDPPGIRRRAALGQSRLREAMTIDSWGAKLEPIPPPPGEPAPDPSWRFIPSPTVPWRGLAFRILEPYPGFKTFRLPFYFMDRRKGTQRRLETSTLYREQSFDRMGMEERNGFLLICGYRPYVYDLSTGEQIFDPPGDVQGPAVWMKRPASAFVDTAGLRRLQARFR